MRDLSYAIEKATVLANRQGLHKTPLPWLAIIRADEPTSFEMVLYEPSVCIVLQGAKETRLEQVTYRSDAAHCVLGVVNLPVLGAVIEASSTKPYLCLRVDIDPAVVSELLETQDSRAGGSEVNRGMARGNTDDDMVDAVGRLLDAAMELPAALHVLAPLVQRELYWRILQQVPLNGLLSQLVKNGRHYELHKAINWLEANFSRQVSMEKLAGEVGMSLSSFYARFKAVTGMSPIQYRNRLRLVRARKLMISKGYDAAQAGFEVGYQEPAQFSREYSRVFGLPPKRDIARLKEVSLAGLV